MREDRDRVPEMSVWLPEKLAAALMMGGWGSEHRLAVMKVVFRGHASVGEGLTLVGSPMRIVSVFM